MYKLLYAGMFRHSARNRPFKRNGTKLPYTPPHTPQLLSADDFVGVSGTPEGLQMQIDAAKEFADKWRLSANVKKSAVMVCNEDREAPVEHRWKWRVEKPVVVGQ
ncbi:unnamed protein product [Ectocarpus sp. 12 AP-2014]